jgi:Zn finger protein HypA/HybF involved in hydrogenase expression
MSIINCLRCGQEAESTISYQVCDLCRNDTLEFARESEEHVNETKDLLTIDEESDTL